MRGLEASQWVKTGVFETEERVELYNKARARLSGVKPIHSQV